METAKKPTIVDVVRTRPDLAMGDVLAWHPEKP